jgi:hypothetical protein
MGWGHQGVGTRFTGSKTVPRARQWLSAAHANSTCLGFRLGSLAESDMSMHCKGETSLSMYIGSHERYVLKQLRPRECVLRCFGCPSCNEKLLFKRVVHRTSSFSFCNT